jgi:uncharacterized protein (DUF1778 family)
LESKRERITFRLTSMMREQIEHKAEKDATDVASFLRALIADYFSQTCPQSHPNP